LTIQGIFFSFLINQKLKCRKYFLQPSFDRFSELTLAGQLGIPGGMAAAQQMAAASPSAAQQLAAASAPGKARSSMNLGLISGR
jgi:hypothetical protein